MRCTELRCALCTALRHAALHCAASFLPCAALRLPWQRPHLLRGGVSGPPGLEKLRLGLLGNVTSSSGSGWLNLARTSSGSRPVIRATWRTWLGARLQTRIAGCRLAAWLAAWLQQAGLSCNDNMDCACARCIVCIVCIVCNDNMHLSLIHI